MNARISILFVTILAVALGATSAQSQTYKPDWATKIVLPSGGTDPSNLFTITAGSITGAHSWTLPTGDGGNGWVLTTNGSGTLSWTNPASGITLAGDVTGSAGSNAIAATVTAGNDIVAALNAPATAKSMNADVLNYGSTLKVASHALDIDLSHGNTWTGDQLLPADATQAANLVSSVNASTSTKSLNADVLNYDATLTVGTHALGLDLTHSNTWTGKVVVNTGAAKGLQYIDGNQAAGAVLTSDASGNATWTTLSSVGVTSATGTAPIQVNGDNSSHSGAITISATTGSLTSTGSSITVTGTGNTLGANIKADINTAHANSWTGGQTFTGTAYSSNAPTALSSGTTNDWNLGATNTYFMITTASSANATITGITGGADGRMIVLVNANSAGNITIQHDDGSSSTAANRFNLPGNSDIIMAPGGTATFIYDGTSTNHRWRMISAQ